MPQLIRVSNTDGVEIKQIGASAVCARSLEKACECAWVGIYEYTKQHV